MMPDGARPRRDARGSHAWGFEAAIHRSTPGFEQLKLIGLGEIDRAHTSAVTARIAIDAAMTAMQTALARTTGPRRRQADRGDYVPAPLSAPAVGF